MDCCIHEREQWAAHKLRPTRPKLLSAPGCSPPPAPIGQNSVNGREQQSIRYSKQSLSIWRWLVLLELATTVTAGFRHPRLQPSTPPQPPRNNAQPGLRFPKTPCGLDVAFARQHRASGARCCSRAATRLIPPSSIEPSSTSPQPSPSSTHHRARAVAHGTRFFPFLSFPW